MIEKIINAPKEVQERTRWSASSTAPVYYFASFLINFSSTEGSEFLQVKLDSSDNILNASIGNMSYQKIDGGYYYEVPKEDIRCKHGFYYLKSSDSPLKRLTSDVLIIDNDKYYLKINISWLENLMTVANQAYNPKVRRKFYKQVDEQYSDEMNFKVHGVEFNQSANESPNKKLTNTIFDQPLTQDACQIPQSRPRQRRPSFTSIEDLKCPSSDGRPSELSSSHFGLFNTQTKIEEVLKKDIRPDGAGASV